MRTGIVALLGSALFFAGVLMGAGLERAEPEPQVVLLAGDAGAPTPRPTLGDGKKRKGRDRIDRVEGAVGESSIEELEDGEQREDRRVEDPDEDNSGSGSSGSGSGSDSSGSDNSGSGSSGSGSDDGS